MILKGNIRAGGQELARHLMNDHHELDPEDSYQPAVLGNEHVEIAELRGFVSDDLAGAFREIEGVAAGTNCTKPIYSLSINPSEPMSREEYGHAVERIEKKLGLQDQARAVVFHVKGGREHCHVAWSRIDLDRMQARHMEFDRQKLRETARELVREFGHKMPRHLGEDRGTDRFKDRFRAITLAEQGQQERSGLDPAKRKAVITDAYRQADSAAAFRSALHEQGYTLAQGDRRGIVVLDRTGEVHALNRQIEGVKAKEIRETLQLDRLEELPTVQQAKEQIAELARQNAPKRPQERENPAEAFRHAEDTLEALKDAQRANLKAMHGAHRETLAAIRESESERISQTRAAIKDAYRDDWRDLFKRQREEMKAATTLAKSPVRRLQWLLSHDNMDKQQDGAKGYLAAAFSFMTGTPQERIASLRRQLFTDDARTDRKAMFAFVAKGELDFKKLEKTHEAERKELADLQKLANREEVRAIRQDTAERRAELKEHHEEALTVTRAGYDDLFKDAFEALKLARRQIESEGRDMSRGEIAEREQRPQWGMRAWSWDSGARKGMGRGRDDEDDERPFNPPTPGRSFTP